MRIVEIEQHPVCVRLVFSVTMAHGTQDFPANVEEYKSEVLRALEAVGEKLCHGANARYEGMVLPPHQDSPQPTLLIACYDRINVKGRGTVWLVNTAKNPGVDFNHIVGRHVRCTANSPTYRVVAVERSEKNGIVQHDVGLVVSLVGF